MFRTTLALLLIASTVYSFVAPPSQATLACITCVATVKGVEAKALHEGGNVAKHDVDAICLKEVPTHSAEHLCEEYGEHEIDVMVTLIKQGVPPKTICQELKKC
uniref:Saposin B-type domain-containing protein n=1 Tax=Caenorhabditis tropicalis TaxID=1561998 RepID=A0A1I7T545_9PELO